MVAITGDGTNGAPGRPRLQPVGQRDDPDISQQDALVQMPTVSRATGLPVSTLRRLVISQTQGAELGFLGTSCTDVLQLNEALHNLEK